MDSARLVDDGVHQRTGVRDARVRIRVRSSGVRFGRKKLFVAGELRHGGSLSIDRADSRTDWAGNSRELG